MSTIHEELTRQASEQLASFNRKLMPMTKRKILGVKVPDLRKMARQIVRTDWKDWFYQVTEEDSFEEVMLRGMVLGYAHLDIAELVEGIRFYIPLIDEWALCDCAMATWKQLVKYPDEAFDLITPYLSSDNEFEQRFAYTTLLAHFCTSTYIGRVLDLFGSAEPHGYYALMGLSWALSVCYVKFPEPTVQLLMSDRLTTDCKRKAIQKIIESRRSTPEMRQQVLLIRQTLKKSHS